MKCPVLCSYSRRRRSCGKVGIPLCWRDFQAWWESPLLGFSTTCLFHSLGRGANFRDGTSLAGVMPQPSGPVSHAESSVQVLVDGDRASVEFLETLVAEFKGALIVISHDEMFLRHCGLMEGIRAAVG